MINRSNSILNRQAQAFTLVELLVVIAVLAVLSTLILTGATAAREAADRASSIAALRLLGNGLCLATAENNGTLPHFWAGFQFVTKDDIKTNAVGAAAPYIGAEAVERGQPVPGAVGKAYLRKFPDHSQPAYVVAGFTKTEGSTYKGSDINPYPFGYRPFNPPGFLPLKLLQITGPSKQVALIEADGGLKGYQGGVMVPTHPLVEPLSGQSRVALYFDWHVELVPKDQNFYFDKQWGE